MSIAGSLPFGLKHPVQYLKEELAPYPGRFNLLLRVVLACSVIIVTSLALGVPMLMLSLISVMAVTQSNLVVSRLIGVVVILALTLAVGATLLLLKFTYDYPLLRILASSAIFFGCVFMMRASKVGPIFFVVGLIVIFVQTFVDMTDQAELVVRALLWLWVVMVYPVPICLVINTVLMPVEPRFQLKAEIHRQLQAVDARLAFSLGVGAAPPRIILPAVQKGALTLLTLLKMTMMRNKEYRAAKARHMARIATVSRLYSAASALTVTPAPPGSQLADTLGELRRACQALDRSVTSSEPFELPAVSPSGRSDSGIPAIEEMKSALSAFAAYEANPTPPTPPAAGGKKSLFAEDAFTNPVYVQFALKTLMAVLLTWTFYSSVDWFGIHTAMLTCLIVAQSGTGASMRKLWLRLFGLSIGSLLALLMMIYVIPRIDSIVGVLAMTLPVMALCSWLMSGSARISYVGLQTLVTFGLALLMGFGPSTNLTEIRDRIIGVLVGVVVFVLIQMFIWPETDGKKGRASLADLLQTISQMLRFGKSETGPATSVAASQQRMAALTQLGKSEDMVARIALEPTVLNSNEEALNLRLQSMLNQARSIMLAADAVERELGMQDLPDEVSKALTSIEELAASALDRYCVGLRGDRGFTSPAPIPLESLQRALENSSTALPAERKAAIRHSAEDLVGHVSMLPTWDLSKAIISHSAPAKSKMVEKYA